MKIARERLSRIKLVIFDLDGTLVNAYKAIEEALNYTRCQFKLPPVSYSRVKATVGYGDRNFIKVHFPEKLVDKALKIYREKHKEALLKKVKFMPYAKEILSYLKNKGYFIALASNRPLVFTQLIVKKLKMGNFISYILCGDEINKLKPEPDILFKIMDKFKVKQEESLYVGDMTVDIEAARNAHIKSVAVATGSSTLEELMKEKPSFLLNSLRELKRILL